MKVSTLFIATSAFFSLFIFCENMYAQSLETKIAVNEAQIEALRANIGRLEDDLSVLESRIADNEDGIKDSELKYKISKQMLDVAEKNLATPTLIFIAIGAIISLIGFGVYKISKKTFQDKIEAQVTALEEQRKDFEKRFDNFNKGFEKTIEIIEKRNKEDLKQIHRIVADYLSRKGVDLWPKDIKTAIAYGERALRQATLAEMNKSEDLNQIGYYSFYLSNLGYYFAIDQKQKNRARAISLTQEAYDIGIGNQALDYERKLDLVDNYLFAVMKCDDDCEFRKFWIELYEDYKDDLYDRDIWKPDERELFSEYYERIKKM